MPPLPEKKKGQKRVKHTFAQNLALRLRERARAVLAFALLPKVPFTDNIAEEEQGTGGTGDAHDQGHDEDLGRVPHLRGRATLSSDPGLYRHAQKEREKRLCRSDRRLAGRAHPSLLRLRIVAPSVPLTQRQASPPASPDRSVWTPENCAHFLPG